MVDKKAAEFKRAAARKRPATSGNKNVNARARRRPALGMVTSVAGGIRKSLIGPYPGSGR